MTRDLGWTTTELDEHECWKLLRAEEVGRLAVSIANRPDIFPINYVVDHGTVVFKTAEGTKLAAALLGAAVAFEVDGESDGEAWSVVIKGRATEIENIYESLAAVDLPLYPWHVGPKLRFVRVVPDEVTGRRFRIADRRAEHSGETPPRHSAPD